MIRIPLKFYFMNVILLSFLNIIIAATARQCCPPNTYLIEYSKTCSDNKTKYDLECDNGALLLDPKLNENDKFTLKSNGTLVFDGEQRTNDRFCLGKIKRNDSSISENAVALVCFENENEKESEIFSIILRLLMILSTIFLLISLYIYSVLPNIRDLQGKCVMAFICSLIASYITLFVIQTFPNSSQEACIVQAAMLYFFMSACFFWNNIITFNIWKAVRSVSINITENSWSMIYVFWGFGIPLIMVILSFVLEHVPGGNHVRPHFAETRCWFRGKEEIWSYFYGPVSVLLILNTFMFLQSSWTLWKSYKNSKLSRIRSLRFKCIMYLKLFLLMGITWTFEVISYATKENKNIKYLWFLTDCLNSAQGVVIFLILIVFRQKVRLGLLDTKLFNVKWPKSWAKEKIEESSTISFGEVELDDPKKKMLGESLK